MKKEISKKTSTKNTKVKNTTWYKTEWDLSSLYKGPTDPKLEKDVEEMAKLCKAFADKYEKDDSYVNNEDALVKALTDWETLIGKIDNDKPMWYLYNRQSIENSNKDVISKINFLKPRVITAHNSVLFFNLKLAKISADNQKKFLNSEKLKPFKYYLELIFKNAKYNLQEEVEKVLNLKSQTSYDMWVDSFQKLCSEQTVVFKGNKIPFAEAMNKIHQLPTKDRRILHAACMEVLKSISYMAESEINAVYTDKKINDELRGYVKPYSATVLGYQNDEKSVETLVKVVTDNFKIAHRFYKLKSKLLGLKNLEYSDRAIGIGKNERSVYFDEAVQIIQTSFAKANPYYKEVFDMMLKNGQIDVYPKKGKSGGAYCWGKKGLPTIVMLNYIPAVDAVMTLAHEMGHAIHTELAQEPKPLYEHYTISVAEVASTFFENLAFEHMFESLSDKEKIVALSNRLDDFCQTIFRQIACFNFELDLHTEIRKKGSLTVSEIGALHNKNMSAYLGPICKLKETDGYFFEAWSHIRRFFYVYSYAYGALISRALYKKYKENSAYIEKINSFMKAGQTMSPEDIFKSVGIDTSNESFFKMGLESLNDDIDTLEALLKKKRTGKTGSNKK